MTISIMLSWVETRSVSFLYSSYGQRQPHPAVHGQTPPGVGGAQPRPPAGGDRGLGSQGQGRQEEGIAFASER